MTERGRTGNMDLMMEDPVRRNARRVRPYGRNAFFRYAAVLMILCYVGLLLIYASGSTRSFEEVSAAVEASLDTEALVKMDTQALKRYYGLNSADYEGVLFYSSEFSISAEEVLLLEVRQEQQVQEVRDAIARRLESRKDTFEEYAPQQVQLVEEAQVQVRGKFIFLVISPEAETYVSTFADSL